MEIKKVEVKMNKPIYLGQAILDISKTLMYEFWYDYIKPKYGDKARLCYMDTDSFVMNIKTDDFYKDINHDVDKWFDASDYDKNDNRPLEIGKNKKVIGKLKDELGGKIMTEFCALRAKAYAYKLDDDTEMKKAKGTKKCIVKREIMFKNYVDALFNDEAIIRSQQRFRSDHHKVFTEEVDKIAVSSNDDKRIQTFDRITTYPYGKNVFKMCESEILSKNKLIELDEDIDIDTSKIEDIDICKVEDIDICQIEDIDICKIQDIDICEIEDIDICKIEDIDICKSEDIDICKVEDIDICKIEDIDICKIEDVDICKIEDIDICKTKDNDICKIEAIDICKVEDIDICKIEDIDICQIEDIDICKIENIDICKIEDIDICKIEDIDICKSEDIDIC